VLLNYPRLARFVKAGLVLQFSLFFIWACDNSGYQHFQGAAQGTTYHITARLPDKVTHEQVQQYIDKCFRDIDAGLSTYREDSEISKFNKMPLDIPVSVSREFIDVLDISREVYQQSAGAFNPAVNDLVKLWGFGSQWIPGQAQVIPDSDAIAKARLTMNFTSIETNGLQIGKLKPVKLDFNGVAQGYTVDVIANAFAGLGIRDYMIEVGGEVFAKGLGPHGSVWRIGVEMPDGLSSGADKQVFAAVLLDNAGLATSGDYRDYYEIDGKRYSHTIDPVSGRPINNRLASVTVLAKTAGYADAWATALMVLGEDAGFSLAEKRGMPAYFIYRNAGKFEVKTTSAMQAYIEK
jgi:thiamine biosynthesis lipoprotein